MQNVVEMFQISFLTKLKNINHQIHPLGQVLEFLKSTRPNIWIKNNNKFKTM